MSTLSATCGQLFSAVVYCAPTCLVLCAWKVKKAMPIERTTGPAWDMRVCWHSHLASRRVVPVPSTRIHPAQARHLCVPMGPIGLAGKGGLGNAADCTAGPETFATAFSAAGPTAMRPFAYSPLGTARPGMHMTHTKKQKCTRVCS